MFNLAAGIEYKTASSILRHEDNVAIIRNGNVNIFIRIERRNCPLVCTIVVAKIDSAATEYDQKRNKDGRRGYKYFAFAFI
jgi:hypothetical protein